MKQRLNFIFYGIALVLVLIPIGMEQSVGRPMQQPWETRMLSVGIVFLILGKLFTIRQKGRAGGAAGSIFTDLIIVAALCAMIIWMFVKL